jgi:hypothetical protein
MKFVLKIILFICFFNFNSVSYAKTFIIGEELSGYFNYNKHLKIKLSPGEWHVIRKAIEGVPRQQIVGIGKVENNEIQEIIEVYEGKLAGYYVKYVDPIIIEMVFKNQYDGCYERAEYYLLELYRKGSTFNCMIVRHMDMTKLLNYPDDPEDRGIASAYNFWIKSKNLTYPKIMLESYHTYFSRMVGGRWYQVVRFINPELINAPKSNFFTEETSEYHKHNISQFPDHSKTMKKWMSNSSKFHKEFEKMTKAKNRHKLSLDKYILEIKTEVKTEDPIIDQLNKLNDLFKSGVLTKEEFEKAKKKILN